MTPQYVLKFCYHAKFIDILSPCSIVFFVFLFLFSIIIMQYTRSVKTKNCFVVINNRSIRGRPSVDICKIVEFFYICFERRQYPFAVMHMLLRL